MQDDLDELLEGWRFETDSVVDATLMWCPELTLKQCTAVGTGDERTVFSDSPTVPHQNLSHLCNRAHFVDELSEMVGLLSSAGVRLWNRVRVDLLHLIN